MNAITDLVREGPWSGPAGAGSDLRRSASPGHIFLSTLPRGASATVAGVLASKDGEDGDLVLRLIELGFVTGERVRVIAHGYPGREPIAVRVGNTTFALRRFEADHIAVQIDDRQEFP
jgi:ferrous iron transport protein A